MRNDLGFSIPYNNDPTTLDELLYLNLSAPNKIREIYFSGIQRYGGSGRETAESDINSLVYAISRIHGSGIKTNLLINSTCEGIDWYSAANIKELLGYIEELHKNHGLDSITVSNPIILNLARVQMPDIEICASVLGEIDCVQKALIYKNLGADVITPDVNINRNFPLLQAIKAAAHLELKLMVNEGCIYKCPFRKYHFNLTSHYSKEGSQKDFDLEYANFFLYCDSIISKDPSQILKSCWIRPEDTRKYHEITTYFKIVGRSQPKHRLLRMVNAYLDESWDGDLLDIMCASLNNYTLNHGAFLDNKSLDGIPFFDHVISCENNCHVCHYCNHLAETMIKHDVLTNEKSQDIVALIRKG